MTQHEKKFYHWTGMWMWKRQARIQEKVGKVSNGNVLGSLLINKHGGKIGKGTGSLRPGTSMKAKNGIIGLKK